MAAGFHGIGGRGAESNFRLERTGFAGRSPGTLYGLRTAMDYDPSKVDDVVLALLYLNVSAAGRAWKGIDWDSLDRLHERGLISNPKSKVKSVELTGEGERLAEEAFRRHFGKAV